MQVSPVLTIVGARPQFIKAAVVSRALAEAGADETLVHTGQHYDVEMSATFFRELGLPTPAHSLEIGSGSHGAQTGRMLEAIEAAIVAASPRVVLVYGDTNSTLAGALAAAKLDVPVAHVEAGLRSFNRRMPEEINRVVTDHVASLLLAPTVTAERNLAAEGIDGDRVHVVGDVMYDLARVAASRLDGRRGVVDRLGLAGTEFALATIHRAENTDDPSRLEAIVGGLERVAESIPVVLPVHPRTRKTLVAAGRSLDAGVRVIDPVGYLDMVDLERRAQIVVTDSGGVQKEAFFHQRPCVTLRDETEWVELVELGWNRIVPPVSAEEVAAGVLAQLGTTGRQAAPYGDGTSSRRIAELLGTI